MTSALYLSYSIFISDGPLSVFPLLNWFLSFLSVEAFSSSWRAIGPSAFFKSLFLPYRITSHASGQSCIQVLRQERRVWQRRHRRERATSVLLWGSAGPRTDRPNRNIFCLKMAILSIWERSGSMWCFIQSRMLPKSIGRESWCWFRAFLW